MNYSELYEKAIAGDYYALDELQKQAVKGDAEAQYLLFCVLDDITSPYRDVPVAMSWLKKSADNGNTDAQEKYNGLSPDERVKYGICKEGDYDATYVDSKNIKTGGLFSYRGRMSRKSYVINILSLYAIWGGVLLLFYYSGTDLIELIPVLLLPNLCVLYLAFCMLSKRAHDCGHSCFIPFVAIILAVLGGLPLLIVIIFYMFKKGEPNLNLYGPVPNKKRMLI